MRIDSISNIHDHCTGCMACVDVCPKKCIHSFVGNDGFRYTEIDNSSCIKCGKCYLACPIETSEKHTSEQHLYAVYAKDSIVRNGGSSGGMFELLAKHFLSQGYAVCGAAFDGNLLRHRIIDTETELPPLLKSKYIQSDMSGLYGEILSLLKNGKKVFFCGTPCQVSALKNSVSKGLREGFFTADIICHGVPSQETFNLSFNLLNKKAEAV